MKLFGSTKSWITKNKNGENVPYLLMLLITVINKNQESCINFFLINPLVNYQVFWQRKFYRFRNI